uniref:Uncharacterized protein n=1 Tax=Quercus lobata TaxID=97700 RepID=A0A7N2LSZ8_QUELO
MKDYFKNNPKDLFSPLSVDKDTAFHIAAYSEGKELLHCLTDLVEPPSSLFDALQMKNIQILFTRAVALGQTKMVKYLATKVGDLSYHCGRKDQMSILHIAVIGQHFGLPSEFENDACDDGDEAQIPSTIFKKEIFSKDRATWKSLAKGGS